MNQQLDDTVLLRLAKALTNATAEGKVTWHTTPDEDSFRAIFHDGLVRIERAGTIYHGQSELLPAPRGIGLRPDEARRSIS